jgi:invasion protein IalB
MQKTIFAVTLLLSSAAAQAQAQAPSQEAAAKDKGDRVVCRSIEEIGSRLATKRVCMTVRQWEEQQRIDRESAEAAQRTRSEPSGR